MRSFRSRCSHSSHTALVRTCRALAIPTSRPSTARTVCAGRSASRCVLRAACSALGRSDGFTPAQSCWNGVDLDSSDHFSHMAYPIGGETGRALTRSALDRDLMLITSHVPSVPGWLPRPPRHTLLRGASSLASLFPSKLTPLFYADHVRRRLVEGFVAAGDEHVAAVRAGDGRPDWVRRSCFRPPRLSLTVCCS